MKLNYSGMMTALVTPFTNDGGFDPDAMKQLVEFQVNGGVDGLVVCGSTGEAATLDDTEYSEVISCVVDTVKGRVPVIAGTGSNSTARTITLSRIAEKSGVDCLLIVTPFYNKPSDRGIIAHYRAVAEAVPLPIIAYNVPGRTARNMSPSLTIDIAQQLPSVVGVKEASGDIAQVMELVAHRADGFMVLSGDDALALPMIAAGADGLISVASNEIPVEMKAMVDSVANGDVEKARSLHYQWLDLMQANFSDSNPVPVKTVLAAMGLIQESFRLPLVPMEDTARKTILDIAKRYEISI